MLNLATKSNAFGEAVAFVDTEYDGVEFNSVHEEIQHAVTAQGGVLTTASTSTYGDNDEYQLSQSIISGGGYLFPNSDSTANDIVFTEAGANDLSLPTIAMMEEKFLCFKAIITNTGAMTVTYATVEYDLLDIDGAALVGGEIKIDNYYHLSYDGTNFVLALGSSSSDDDYLEVTSASTAIDLSAYPSNLIINLNIPSNAAVTTVTNTLPVGSKLFVINSQTAYEAEFYQSAANPFLYYISPLNGLTSISDGSNMILESMSNGTSTYDTNTICSEKNAELAGGLYREQTSGIAAEYRRFPDMNTQSAIRATASTSATDDDVGAEIYIKDVIVDTNQTISSSDLFYYFRRGTSYLSKPLGYLVELVTDWLSPPDYLTQGRRGEYTSVQNANSNSFYDAKIQGAYKKSIADGDGIFTVVGSLSADYRFLNGCISTDNSNEVWVSASSSTVFAPSYILRYDVNSGASPEAIEIYDGTGDYRNSCMAYSEVRNKIYVGFRTTNSGGLVYSGVDFKHWITHGTIWSEETQQMAVDANDDLYLLTVNDTVSTTAYLRKSSNGGLSFSQVWGDTVGDGTYNAMCRSYPGGTVYFSIYNLVYKWDGSITIFAATIPDGYGNTIWAGDLNGNEIVFIGTTTGKVYRTDDGGASWVLAYTGVNAIGALVNNDNYDVFSFGQNSVVPETICYRFINASLTGAIFSLHTYVGTQTVNRAVCVKGRQQLWAPQSDTFSGSTPEMTTLETEEHFSTNEGTPIQSRLKDGKYDISVSNEDSTAADEDVIFNNPSLAVDRDSISILTDVNSYSTSTLSPNKSIYRDSDNDNYLFVKEPSGKSYRVGNRDGELQGFFYQASPITTGSPADTILSWDDLDHTLAESIYMSSVDILGSDIYKILNTVVEDAIPKYMMISEVNDISKTEIYQILSAIVTVDEAALVVSYEDNNGSLVSTSDRVVVSFFGRRDATSDLARAFAFQKDNSALTAITVSTDTAMDVTFTSIGTIKSFTVGTSSFTYNGVSTIEVLVELKCNGRMSVGTGAKIDILLFLNGVATPQSVYSENVWISANSDNRFLSMFEILTVETGDIIVPAIRNNTTSEDIYIEEIQMNIVER